MGNLWIEYILQGSDEAEQNVPQRTIFVVDNFTVDKIGRARTLELATPTLAGRALPTELLHNLRLSNRYCVGCLHSPESLTSSKLTGSFSCRLSQFEILRCWSVLNKHFQILERETRLRSCDPTLWSRALPTELFRIIFVFRTALRWLPSFTRLSHLRRSS